MYMRDTTLILAELIIGGVTFFAIFWLIYEIGKFALALTELERSVNTLEQVSTMINGLETSAEELRSKLTDAKCELTSLSHSLECSKSETSNDLGES